MIVYSHPDCLLKDNGFNHPERKERITSIIDSIKKLNELNVEFKESPLANLDTVFLVHPQNHIKKIFSNIPKKGLIGVEKEPYADTMLCPNSERAILRACGAGIAAADDLINKNDRIFCAVRPPGHHAEFSNGMGFCVFNNIAVGAAYAREELCVEKIAIIDIDVHHGNGTEDWVRGKNNFLFFSVHQSPLYPGTGQESNYLEGINNYTLLPGSNSLVFREIISNKLIPLLEKLEPDLILISIGFDGHKLDKLADINLSSLDYRWVTEEICRKLDKRK